MKETSRTSVSKTTRSRKQQDITLLEAIEQIVSISEESALDAGVMPKLKPWSSYLAQCYGITERQAIIFSICMENRTTCSRICSNTVPPNASMLLPSVSKLGSNGEIPTYTIPFYK